MFLLIPDRVKPSKIPAVSIFTFHNVSINTMDGQMSLFDLLYLHSIMFLLIRPTRLVQPDFYLYLHSIMFLLILSLASCTVAFAVLFTFHNVSINTGLQIPHLRRLSYLHSIMFLLIPRADMLNNFPMIYLHSIMFLLILTGVLTLFHLPPHLHSIMFLLIPSASMATVSSLIIYIP